MVKEQPLSLSLSLSLSLIHRSNPTSVQLNKHYQEELVKWVNGSLVGKQTKANKSSETRKDAFVPPEHDELGYWLSVHCQC